jgi:hypothetical protein
MTYKIGNEVKLNSFNGTLKPDDNCQPHENYWRLIGYRGKIVKEPNSKSRVLVQFTNDISSLGLECHNDSENSLWILESDLIEI